MARGRTKSKLTLRERKAKAFDLFSKGYADTEVARRLKVTRQTANSYRRQYEQDIHEQARSNPTLLREVLANTMRSLSELDKVRSSAWRSMEDRTVTAEFVCESCGDTNLVKHKEPISDQSRAQYLNTLLKAQDQRAKLFGVLGVKADMLVAMAQVKIVQEKMIEWMSRNLDGAMREALADFLENELAQYVDNAAPIAALDVVDAEVVYDNS